jgi:outer membrane lipoprotein SlyB
MMKTKTMKVTAAVVAGALVLGGCTASEQRVASGGLLGAGAGALIGGAVGGSRGALVGALIGGAAGLIIADAIERERAREAAIAAVRSGQGNVRSFRNSSGQAVVVRTRVVRTYVDNGQRVRVVERSMSRNGQNAGSETIEGREVKLANGQTQWTGIE